MGDPLLSIDAENVEKSVNDSFKTMHKSVKLFNEIPGMIVICIPVSVQFN